MEPKFKVGDQVKWLTGAGQQGQITDGPFEGIFSKASSYVVQFASIGPRLLGEFALEPLETWVHCPGEHRFNEGIWEKKVYG